MRSAFPAARRGHARRQLAVLLLRTLEGGWYQPPPAVGQFADVPVADPFAPWIEEIARRGITAGCGGGLFCPDAAVDRDQAAVLLTRGFGLGLEPVATAP